MTTLGAIRKSGIATFIYHKNYTLPTKLKWFYVKHVEQNNQATTKDLKGLSSFSLMSK